MKSETPVIPRKNPKQERSQTLVQSVVEATTRVLERYGYAQATTNRVAEVAGVSIGSLYQYFPGKDALVAAVLERQATKMMNEFEDELKTSADLKPAELIDFVVARTVDFYFANERITRELFLHFGHLQKTEFLLGMRRRTSNLIADVLIKHQLSNQPEQMGYVIANGVMGVILVAVMDEQKPFSKEEMTAQLSTMVKSYLGLTKP